MLEVGSNGSDVTKVQKRLIQYGYMTGSADGKYGEKTRDAVIWFQKRNGLTADGRVGSATAAALGVTLGSSGSTTASTTILSADHRLLAKLVYAEARGETYKGQVAVAAVVLGAVAVAVVLLGVAMPPGVAAAPAVLVSVGAGWVVLAGVAVLLLVVAFAVGVLALALSSALPVSLAVASACACCSADAWGCIASAMAAVDIVALTMDVHAIAQSK